MTRSSFACALAFLALAVTACGGDDGDSPAIDAAGIDTPGVQQTCANYCSTIATNCTTGLTQYSEEAACLATCAFWQPGAATDMAGNTRGCRIYHAGVAAGAPDVHCRHAGPGGDGACGTNCEGFCTLAMGACAGQANPPYADTAACMTACNGFATTPTYSASVTGGDSFACRLYHATAASTNPATHCPHTGVTSATCN